MIPTIRTPDPLVLGLRQTRAKVTENNSPPVLVAESDPLPSGASDCLLHRMLYF
jgi:hypothetical protein